MDRAVLTESHGNDAKPAFLLQVFVPIERILHLFHTSVAQSGYIHFTSVSFSHPKICAKTQQFRIEKFSTADHASMAEPGTTNPKRNSLQGCLPIRLLNLLPGSCDISIKYQITDAQ
jgi:hypothetical protein